MLINAGIKEVVVMDGYPDQMAEEFLGAAGVRVRFKRRRQI
jgi:deoxycytidylate deaminase